MAEVRPSKRSPTIAAGFSRSITATLRPTPAHATPSTSPFNPPPTISSSTSSAMTATTRVRCPVAHRAGCRKCYNRDDRVSGRLHFQQLCRQLIAAIRLAKECKLDVVTGTPLVYQCRCRVTGSQKHSQTWPQSHRFAGEFNPVHAWHHDIGEQDVDVIVAAQDREPGRSVRRGQHLIAVIAQHRHGYLEHRRVVLDNKYPCGTLGRIAQA